jgi:transposase InsO family protein
MSSIQELVSIGEKIGLKGEPLQKFVTEQQALARDAREKEREERDKERQVEKEKRENDLRREELRNEVELKRLEAGKASKAADAIQFKDESEEEEEATQWKTQLKLRGPKLASFDESRDDMDSFVHRFEQYAALQGWKRNTWAVYLAALLKGRALDVYARLPPDEATDYAVLKEALLRRFNKTEEGYKHLFYTSKAEVNESPQLFMIRLHSYLTRWMELAGIEKTIEGLQALIIREQFLSTCTKELELFLRERAITELSELAKLAEQFIDAHRSKTKGISGVEKQVKPSVEKIDSRKGAIVKRCYVCNKEGHIAKNCFRRQKTAAMENSGPRRWNTFREQYPKVERSDGNAWVRKPSNETNQTSNRREVKCKMHGKELCPECLDIEGSQKAGHECSAILANGIELKCGCRIPVVADACSTERRQRMPVSEGYINGKKVSVLRDSGCSTVVVRRSLVDDSLLTGAETVCVLIDGTVRRTPVANIEIDTKFYKGKIDAVCMRDPLYDLIIGNVDEVKDVYMGSKPQEIQAVMTRKMREEEKKPAKPLKVGSEINTLVSRDDLIKMQKEDETLSFIWRKLEQGIQEINARNETDFIVQEGILYRTCKGYDGNVITQLVVPTPLRQAVLKLAHESIMSGHQGITRTRDRIFTSFWFPGMTAEVTRFCKSCDVCQRTVSKGKVRKAPLGKMPIIETPFERVAIDLVGPIFPASDRGHRYILSLVDYATRYAEAAVLKNIQTETVAEALVDMFARVGVPKEVLSDQGSQFVSGLMKEVSRLLSIKQLIISPYHPICNGLCEKFNGTLKTMLKRVCAERPKDWDRFIAPLLFAYREAKQESLGFAPFELVYGRTVRGPMRILRELWTQEEVEPEVKTTYEYVLDLRNRIQETCEMAHEELAKAQERQRKYYNVKAVKRVLKPGSKVLVLRPMDKNKLLMQWQGPFVVRARQRENDYEIEMKGRTRIYHANMLKEYFERDNSQHTLGCEEDLSLDTESEEVYERVGAAVIEHKENEREKEMTLLNSSQTESFRDVKINPDLNAEKQDQIMLLLTEFQDIFTDVPRICNLGEHEINLTTNLGTGKE